MQVIWRMKQLGFNAVRLPYKFTDLAAKPLIIEHQCQVAPAVRALDAAGGMGFLTLQSSVLWH